MDILLIENVSMANKQYHFFDKLLLTTFSILPTLTARQLAAATPKQHTVSLLNQRYHAIDYKKPYDLVTIIYTTSTAPRAYEIAQQFKQNKVPVVLGGMHPSLLPDEAKKHADSVLIGRDERSWIQLLNDAEQHQLKAVYKPSQSQQFFHPPPTNVALPGLIITGAIEATRGCPYSCIFCPESTSAWKTSFTMRPVEEVVEEIRQLPQKTFMFYDASLTINPTYTKALFTKMKGLHKKFFCNGNPGVLAHDEGLVKLSKEAGCGSSLR